MRKIRWFKHSDQAQGRCVRAPLRHRSVARNVFQPSSSSSFSHLGPLAARTHTQFIFQSPASYRSLRAHTHRRATSRERRVEAGDHRPPFAAGPTSCSRYRLISTPRLCTPASEDRAWNVGAAAIFIMPPQGRVWAGENVRGPPSASNRAAGTTLTHGARGPCGPHIPVCSGPCPMDWLISRRGD